VRATHYFFDYASCVGFDSVRCLLESIGVPVLIYEKHLEKKRLRTTT